MFLTSELAENLESRRIRLLAWPGSYGQAAFFAMRLVKLLPPIEIDDAYENAGHKGNGHDYDKPTSKHGRKKQLGRDPKARGYRTKKGRATGVGREPMVGMFSRTTREAVVQPTPSLSHRNIEAILEGRVAPGSDIFTDEQVSYWFIGDKYTHQVVEHSTRQWVNGDAHTNNIECIWSLWRSFSRPHRGFSVEHLAAWAGWFVWLRNHRAAGSEWLRIICASIMAVPGGLLRKLQAKGIVSSIYPLLSAHRSVSIENK